MTVVTNNPIMGASDIIKAQQGLARKAQADKQHQFDNLYFLLTKREWIADALQHVLTNDGALTAGVDGMSWKSFNDVTKSDFDNEQFKQTFIDSLQLELKTHSFKPLPVKRVEIPKPGSDKKRPLGIATIKDRTVQTLLKMVLEPIWESDFYYFSNGFRPTRCTMDCIAPLYQLCNTSGYSWVIEGDIRACFDTIPQTKLLTEVSRRIADAKILKLIGAFLRCGVMSRGKFAPTEEGTPQGAICSPLLANIYLHRFDEWFSQQHWSAPDPMLDRKSYDAWRRPPKGKKQGSFIAAQMFRYADDWVILIRGNKAQAQQLKQQAKQFLWEELGLELSDEKTKLTHIKDGFDFLGYHVFKNYQARPGKRTGLFVKPTLKGLARVKLKIKEMTSQSRLNDDYLLKLKALNAVIRGWASYYRAVNAYETFSKLDRYVWWRLTKWLAKKHRIGPLQVKRQYQKRREGPKGGHYNFVVFDESSGKWLWRYKATDTKIVYHRPLFKRHWPNPYLEKRKAEHYELPTLKTLWSGIHQAPIAEASRRVVLGRAKGACERCGKKSKLFVHHRHRIGKGRRNEADNRPEMLEAVCIECHSQEHRAEVIQRNRKRAKKGPSG